MRRCINLLVWAIFIFLAAVPATPARADLQDDLQQGYSLLDQWRVEEADAYARQLADAYPETGDVFFLQARIEFYKGDYAESLKVLAGVDDSTAMVKELKHLVTRTQAITSKFVTRETDHFLIRYPGGPDELLTYYAPEVLEASYAILGEIIGHFPKEKVRIDIYPDRVPFSEVSPLTLEEILTSGTVALCKYRRIMLMSPASAVRGYNWMDTLSHEFVHYLLSSASHNNVPLWFHEGIAKYLETRWRNTPYLSPVMKTVLASGLKNDYLIPLENMMPSLAKLKSAEDVHLAYAEVATMVEFMVQLKGETVIGGMVRSLRDGVSFDRSLETHVGMNLQAFQAAWKEHFRTKNLKSIPGLKVLRFEFKNKKRPPGGEDGLQDIFSALGGKQARDWTLLGDILQNRQFADAAIVEYSKAIQEAKSRSPILYNKLAETYLEKKQFPKAEKLLLTSLGYYPEFPATLANLGTLYFHTQRVAEA
ncbi:MAG: peptidase MA family metallohydrolase, partial [Nitrospinaceae bacterium]